MAIGSVWAAGSWADAAWAEGAWADAEVVPSGASVRGSLALSQRVTGRIVLGVGGMTNHVCAGNDLTVRATGLRNDVTGAYLNAATVTAQLYDDADEAVGAPATLTLVAGSTTGDYVGVIESDVIDAGFAVGDFYRLQVTVAEGAADGQFNFVGEVGRRMAD